MFRSPHNQSPSRRSLAARLRVEILETRALLSAGTELQTLAISNDTYYNGGYLWGMYGDDLPTAVGAPGTTNGYGSQAEKAWAAGYTGSRGVYVGVIDEGIQFAHPDLAANVWTNPKDPVDGIDNDGNGYRDDIHGWDFYYNNNSVYDGGYYGTQDRHGTHVAGTIGAVGGNSRGVVGVNWAVNIIPAKFLGPYGGSTTNAIRAVNYLVDLKVNRGVNVVAINASWGGGGFSQGLYDAIRRANDANILFVAAAGNSGVNLASSPQYPASYDLPNIISVAAIDRFGNLASFSNYGGTTVELGAPGVSILSTLPNSKYAYYSGTSMAAPHVTGAAALYAAANPGATAAQIKEAILSSATATPSLAGRTITGGRLNVGQLMQTPLPSASGSTSGGTEGGGSTGGTGTAAASVIDDPLPGQGAILTAVPAIAASTPLPPLVLVTFPPVGQPPAPLAVAGAEREVPILSRVVGGVGEGVPAGETTVTGPGVAAPAPQAPATPPAAPAGPEVPQEMPPAAVELQFSTDAPILDLQDAAGELPAADGVLQVEPASLGALAGLAMAFTGYWSSPLEPESWRRRTTRRWI
jgi:subtilisin family serine protease